MHKLSSAFVLAYHGCDTAIAEHMLAGHGFSPSTNDYDWLGHGVYFWEANPKRGLEFATEKARRTQPGSKTTKPTVVGAVIDLGLCLDLTSSQGIDKLTATYEVLCDILENSDKSDLPKNSQDGLRRNLDCAVVNTFHDILRQTGQAPVDTVRGIFVEGTPIYAGSGFHSKTHIQICVRNTSCIKGVFRVRAADLA